jgi:simple sugar transport system permease protein
MAERPADPPGAAGGYLGAPLEESSVAELPADERLPRQSRLARPLDALVRGVGPVLLALVAGGILLLALGRNPVIFYANIYQGGITQEAWQDSAMRMAPLLLIAGGLIVVFRANIWNLGYQGQFLLAGAMIAGLGPRMETRLPYWLTLTLLFMIAGVVGASWTVIPALLKAYYQVNEIITTLMMSFIGISAANILIKGPFQDFSSNVPQTSVLPVSGMLPNIPHTRIHVGILVALGTILVVHYVLTRTSFGLRLQVLGASPRAAVHAGVGVKRLIITAFLISGALVGMAAAAEVLGIEGYVRADWNPVFGDAVIPFVFLARLNALAVIPFVAFYSILAIGGEYATQQAQLPTDFLLVVVGLILLFMTVTEYVGRKRALGSSYLTPGLAHALRRRTENA